MKKLQCCLSNFSILRVKQSYMFCFSCGLKNLWLFFWYGSWLHYNHFQILPLTRINQPVLSSGLLWPGCCQYQSLFKSSWGILVLLYRYRCFTFHYQSFMLASSMLLNWNFSKCLMLQNWLLLKWDNVLHIFSWAGRCCWHVQCLLFTPPPAILCTSRWFQLRQGFCQLQQSAAPLALLLVPCVVQQPLRAEDHDEIVSRCPALHSTVLAGHIKGEKLAWQKPKPVAGMKLLLFGTLLSCTFVIF